MIQEINIPWDTFVFKYGLPELSGQSVAVPEMSQPLIGELTGASRGRNIVVALQDGLPDKVTSKRNVRKCPEHFLNFGDPPKTHRSVGGDKGDDAHVFDVTMELIL